MEAVWAVLADPVRWPEWWPGLVAVEPSVRHALAPGAHWQLEGTTKPSLLRKPQASGSLLVLEVVQLERVVFQLVGEGIHAELDLARADGDGETVARLALDAPFLSGARKPFVSKALAGLAALVRPEAG